MSFVTTNLGTYVAPYSKKYSTESVANATLHKALIDSGNFQAGLKPGEHAVLKLDLTATFSDGGCGWTGASSAELASTNITVKGLKAEYEFCTSDLWGKFAAISIAKGQSPQEEFEGEFVNTLTEQIAANVAEQSGKISWEGDTTITGTTNLNKVTGVLKQITGSTTHTGSTIVEKFQNWFLSVAPEISSQADFRLIVSKTLHDEYKVALANKNIYQPTMDDVAFGTSGKFLVLPETTSRYGVATRLSNLQLGMDGESDSSDVNWYYDQKEKKYFVTDAFAQGIVVIRQSEAKKGLF